MTRWGFVVFGLVACSSTDGPREPEASGGASGSGGRVHDEVDAAPSTGGRSPVDHDAGSGGRLGTVDAGGYQDAGAPEVGDDAGEDAPSSTGGRGTGGTTSTGGARATGGVANTATGGTSATGGSTGTGGAEPSFSCLGELPLAQPLSGQCVTPKPYYWRCAEDVPPSPTCERPEYLNPNAPPTEWCCPVGCVRNPLYDFSCPASYGHKWACTEGSSPFPTLSRCTGGLGEYCCS